MSLPTPGDVHVNAPMTNFSLLYAQSLDRFAADKLFPIVTSDKESNVYFSFDKKYWARDTMKVRAIGAEAAEGAFGVTTGSFLCINYALQKKVPDRLRRNSDNPLNQDRAATRYLTQMERIRREKQFATDILKTSLWTSEKTGVSGTPTTNQFKQWNDSASTPVEDIRSWRTEVDKNTLGAARPNVLGLGKEVWDKLADHPDIVDRLKYGGQLQGNLAKVTPAMLAALLELDEVIIGDALEETATEGQSTSVPSYIWGKKALLLYRNPTPQIEEVSAGYTICWTDTGSNAMGARIKQYRMENVESDIFEIQSSFVQKPVAVDAGAYIASAVA